MTNPFLAYPLQRSNCSSESVLHHCLEIELRLEADELIRFYFHSFGVPAYSVLSRTSPSSFTVVLQKDTRQCHER